MITLTEKARERLAEILAAQGRPGLGLRVYVTPGGCSGLSYGMSLEQEPADDDHIISPGGVTVVVDPFSAQYIQGAQIDFVEALMGGGFTILNPNAVTSCACGSSFKTAAAPGRAKPCH